ncbi:MAG TPA: 2OG-Fe(II) oxygenase, partial [Rhodospirillales bacterium]|nr:2OG-Fe(II) oxygenase [Rhodospirillales bacterium]
LRYLPGEEYKPHYDFIRPWGPEAASFAAELAEMGQRAATVLVYLNEGYEGGETVFTRLGLTFKGAAGDALIFWNVSPSGELERDSMHAGAPVAAGRPRRIAPTGRG